MDAVFLKLLNMNIAASWLILAVLVLRFLLKKAPKWLPCILWAVVAIRLICPFSFESDLSLIPSAETVSLDILYAQVPVIHSGIPALNNVVNPVITDSFAPTPGASINPLQVWTYIASYVWLLGISAMLIYATVSFLRLRKKVGASINIRDNLWICDDIKTPFILGIISPRIYLPSAMDEAQQAYVIAHETAICSAMTTGGSRWGFCYSPSTGSTPCCGWPISCSVGMSSWPATSGWSAKWVWRTKRPIPTRCSRAACPGIWSLPVHWPLARWV
jgi:beta-lactamase regulating signal transducer with metallopeptidase domain